MHPHVELLQRLFAAFEEGDLATIEAALAEDVTSTTAGDNQLAGTAIGRDAVLTQLRRSAELTDGSYEIAVEDLLAGERHAAVLYRATGRRLGRELATRMVGLYGIDDGRVTEIRFVALDPPAFDAFWR